MIAVYEVKKGSNQKILVGIFESPKKVIEEFNKQICNKYRSLIFEKIDINKILL